MSTPTETLAYREGGAGRLRLNRPKALNALNLPMVQQMTRALLDWREDRGVRLILIDHAEGRGFCAGGDVVTIARSAQGHGAAGQAFFFQEYRLNHLMYTYPKPGVVFMDGVTMGGGVGIACPCRYRVVTERTMFAMPETAIGLFPDVGGGRYLSRLRGRAAQYLALTGARLDGADCIALGLANYFIPSERLDALKAELCATPEKVESILAGAAVAPPLAKIVDQLPLIDRLFASDDYEEILAALETDGSDWALKQLDTLRPKSPTACKVSLRMLVESPRQPHFVDEMRMEFGIAARMFRHPDFGEGVRALLIDKDNQPIWNPATPEGVTAAMVDGFFQPLPASQAWTPLPAPTFDNAAGD
ncbi:enoyl-CoA hydratase/isomerase family protein [Sphingomonas alpina]|uniref:3-hydroxyisobutyryl-CoA hydrolase n=1 Tax=Sphingomonas alpina TaxID=653931 RepID=A0A7H0LQR9_9SPHN|nr:enoyl-CoA hydratase/isomerase family protein [Sphingomonas alpina]QNQ12022.1 enoyl-CoA hydratase/isomerase family protein [Sphingomonas alpina]